MPISPIGLAKYRYYRLALAVAMGLVTLLFTLGIRIYEQKQVIGDDQQRVASHTVEKLDKLFFPVQNITPLLTIDSGQQCATLQPSLQQSVAKLQTLRAIAIVKDARVVCSSLLGALDLDFSKILPHMLEGVTNLELRPTMMSTDPVPTLIYWQPHSTDNRNGLLFIYNIDILSSFLLEPQPPFANRIVLNVMQQSLEYDKKSITPRASITEVPLLDMHSEKYNFSVAIYDRPPIELAWSKLPSHFPLSILISLLASFAIYLFSGSRISLAYPISHAISHREFQVYCQPIINSEDGQCIGVETLMRWKNRRQEWVSPDVFIPLAEQHGLIIALTRYLIKQVSDNLAYFPCDKNFYISINVAAQHFNNMEILKDIRDIWLPADPQVSLMLELTERTRLQELTAEQIEQLKAIGVQLAIDDFGTGHSSLSYLKTLNPDVLKIDRAFTAAIGTDAINATVTDSIITLAQRLKLKLIAEGVETLEQADYLRNRKVEALQGYYFARPMPIDVFPIWLERYQQDNIRAEAIAD